MQHAREVRWQCPVLEAPHLCGRSRCSDPQPLRARMRRVGIVGLARRLAIALWRYLQTGEIPIGARLKPAGSGI